MTDKINTAMLDIFRLEATSQLSVLKESYSSLQKDKTNSVEVDSLLRAFTALKGAAKISSIMPIFELARQFEEKLNLVKQNKSSFTDGFLDVISESCQLISEFIVAIDSDPQDWIDSRADAFKKIVAKFNNEQNSSQVSANSDEPLIKSNTNSSLGDLSMLELFRMETEEQTRILNENLIALETHSDDAKHLEQLMRSSHSIKGAARMVGLDAAVQIAHLAEDIFVAAQKSILDIKNKDLDLLLMYVDMLQHIADATKSDYHEWELKHNLDIENLKTTLSTCLAKEPFDLPQLSIATNSITIDKQNTAHKPQNGNELIQQQSDNTIRVSGTALNRLLSLAGEAQVASRWLEPFSTNLLQVKRRQTELSSLLDQLRDKLFDLNADEHTHELVQNACRKSNTCRDLLSDRMTELESFDRRASSLSYRLNREILETRMRPFSEGVHGFQRLVRDISNSLEKDVKLSIRGLATRVDRDILEKLQAPLNHMIRNAIDHGVETKEDRLAAGKTEQGSIRIEAMHSAGMLSIIIQDDGAGIDQVALRKKIVAKGMVNQEMAGKLSESELFDFLFLPNFSTCESVSEISGRGVGLDVVHSTIQELRGQIRATSTFGEGLKFHIQLPLTLSVVRVLLVEIANEIYAFPLAKIDQTLKLQRSHIETMEGRQYFTYGDRHIGIITAHQLLQTSSCVEHDNDIPVVILGDKNHQYGIVIDDFIGERNLIVHPIDSRLGKIQDISAASLTEDGLPILIFDTDDLLRSIDILLSDSRINKLGQDVSEDGESRAKRVLIVDDSITVREVERNLLTSKGYYVEVAIDGMDGWNAVRTNHYDLIVSDIDMPRMNGFEFVNMLKNDERLKNIPVIIVSYKDREEDRERGLEVGADYYLTKGSFHDDTLVEAALDLIGPA